MRISVFVTGCLVFMGCFFPFNSLRGMDEIDLPSYYELEEVNGSSYYYKFLANKARHIFNPIFIEIENKESIQRNTGIVCYANFKIFNSNNEPLYFYKNNEDTIKIMNVNEYTRKRQEYKKLSIPIYIYGFNKVEDITTHAYGMEKENDKWKGYFEKLDIVIKYKQQCVNILEKKWVKTYTKQKSFSSIALALLCKSNEYYDVTKIVNDYKINLNSSQYNSIKIDTESLYRLRTRTDQPVDVVLCRPYVKDITGSITYLKVIKKNKNLKPKTEGKIFSFQAYLHGIDSKKNSIEVLLKKNPLKGSLENWNFSIKQNGEVQKPIDSKWIEDCKYGCGLFALAMTFEKDVKLKNQDIVPSKEVIINHKNGIAYVKDIFFEDSPTESKKDYFTFKPDSGTNQKSNYSIVINNTGQIKQYQNKKVIVDLIITNPEEHKKFCFIFKPGTRISLDGKEYEPHPKDSDKDTVLITVKDKRNQTVPGIKLFYCKELDYCDQNKKEIEGSSDSYGKISMKLDKTIQKIIFPGDVNYGYTKKTFDTTISNIDFVLSRKSRNIYFRVEDENNSFKNGLYIKIKGNRSYLSCVNNNIEKTCHYIVELPIYPNEPFPYSVYSNSDILLKTGNNKTPNGFDSSNPIVAQFEPVEPPMLTTETTIIVKNKVGTPIPDIDLSFIYSNTSKRIGTTDANGVLTYKLGNKGTIKTIETDDYQSAQRKYNKEKTITITLKCKERTLKFNIINSVTQAKIPNAKIVINERYKNSYSNGNYLVNFPACINEQYSVSINANGFIEKRGSKFFTLNDNRTPLQYTLEPVPRQIRYRINTEPFYKDQEIKDAFDYDDDIKIKVSCDEKDITLDYNQIDNHFSGAIDCQAKQLKLTIESKLFDMYEDSIKLDKDVLTIQPEMKIKKPVFYLLINPSLEFNKGFLKTDKAAFDDFKKNLLYNIVRHFDSGTWSDKWSKVFFYKHINNKTPKLLQQRDKNNVQWNVPTLKTKILKEIEFHNASIRIETLIDNVLSILNKMSLSDSSGFKGLIVLNLPIPADPYYQKKEFLSKLEKKLKTNKVVAYIALFGMVNKTTVYTKKDNSHLQLKEFNMKTEFYDRYYANTCVKILNDIEDLLRLCNIYINH